MKKTILVTLIIVVSVVLVTGCKTKKAEREKEEINQGNVNINTEEEVIGDKVIEMFKFENTSLIYDSGVTKLETRITNISEEEQVIIEFRIHVIKGEEEIANLPGYVGSTIKAGEQKILTTTYGMDLTSATKIEYEIVR